MVAGCAYQGGSFHSMDQPFPGARASAGCLDIAIKRRPDLAHSAVVEYAFGNRCERPAVVDLASALVVSRNGDSTPIRLKPFDPRHEIVPREIDGLAVGGEAIAYLSAGPVDSLCVDPGTIARTSAEGFLCLTAPSAEDEQ